MIDISAEIAAKELVINFAPTGEVNALHMDKFDLGFLGKKTLGRASTIEFDEEDQSFFVLPDGETEPFVPATRFSGYDVARSFEIDWLQECMKAECTPHSRQGKLIAINIRVDRGDLYPYPEDDTA